MGHSASDDRNDREWDRAFCDGRIVSCIVWACAHVLRPRPPHYRGWSRVVITMSLVATGWSAGAWLLGPDQMSGLRAIVGGLVMALIVGAGQAWETGHRQQKHGLSRWENF